MGHFIHHKLASQTHTSEALISRAKVIPITCQSIPVELCCFHHLSASDMPLAHKTGASKARGRQCTASADWRLKAEGWHQGGSARTGNSKCSTLLSGMVYALHKQQAKKRMVKK
eukprot:1159547-Pelagomonas_calceolata.AAC.22